MTTANSLRRALAAALTALLVLSLAACSGDDGEADTQAIIDAMVESGATVEQAECFVDELGPEQAQLIADNMDAQEAPEGVDEQAFTDAALACIDLTDG